MKSMMVAGRVLGLSSTLLVTSPAWSQSTEGAVRLSLDGILFSGVFSVHERSSLSDELETSSTNAGLYAGSFGLGIGYAFGKNGVIGARLIHGSGKVEVDGTTDSSTTRFSLLPYAEYVATSSPTIQPFVAASAGFQVGSNEVENVESTISAFMFGLSAGLHLFATDTFSIDPHFSYYRATGSASSGGPESDYGANVFLLGFSLSGWIGGIPSRSREREETSEALETDTTAAVTEPSTPATPPSEPPVELKLAEEGDLLSGALGLGIGQLTLLGRPTVDGGTIAVRVTARGEESADCRSVTLIAGEERVELRDVIGRPRQHGSMTVVVLQGNVSPQELSAFTDADVTRLSLCGRVVTVTAEQREAIAQYSERFRHRAVEAGTWDATPAPSGAGKTPATAPIGSQPAPAAATSPPSPSTQAPAPAKPGPKTQVPPAAPPTPPASGSAPPTGSFEDP